MGYSLALIELGKAYAEGKGVRKDENRAFAIYQQAAAATEKSTEKQDEGAHLAAQHMIALCYAEVR